MNSRKIFVTLSSTAAKNRVDDISSCILHYYEGKRFWFDDESITIVCWCYWQILIVIRIRNCHGLKTIWIVLLNFMHIVLKNGWRSACFSKSLEYFHTYEWTRFETSLVSVKRFSYPYGWNHSETAEFYCLSQNYAVRRKWISLHPSRSALGKQKKCRVVVTSTTILILYDSHYMAVYSNISHYGTGLVRTTPHNTG
jgi:hypothetical protein